jgi:hypothetical protein
MPEITVNASDYAMRQMREQLAGWAGALDAKRPRAWDQYGYTEHVSFDHLLTAYKRGGAGHGAVHRLLDRCWLECPRIKQREQDAETDWEKAVDKLLRPLWRRLRDFDRRNMVGRYAGLIYRVADGQTLDQPLKRGKLVDLVPVWENQLRVQAWNQDEASPTFGKVTVWEYRMRAPHATDTQAAPDRWVKVHASRVQILAEGAAGGEFYEGEPLLLAGFNHLVDLEKIAGGSAESFLKNSARTVVLKFDANSQPQAIASNADGTSTGQTVAEAVEEKVGKLNRNIDASIVMQGGDATTLQTAVADPGPSFQVAANLFAASVQIPFTILFGQQTGRLASSEDKADWNARCQSRRETELGPMLEELVTRMQAAGAIDAADFEVEWAPLDSPGDDAKATLLGKMTSAMQQASAAGLTEPLFDANELRGVMDFEERTDDGLPEGTDPMVDPAQPPAPTPAPPPVLRAAA